MLQSQHGKVKERRTVIVNKTNSQRIIYTALYLAVKPNLLQL